MKKFLTTLAVAGLALYASPLPDYKKLCADLGEISGWKADECEGMKMSNPMMGEMVTASRLYTRGDASLEAAVLSGMQATMSWAPYAAGTTMESDQALVKIEKIRGFPVGISYDKQAHSGGIVVQLAPNAVLAVNFEKMGWKEALEEVKKLDWKRLAAEFSK